MEEILADFFGLFGSCRRRFVKFGGERAGLTSADSHAIIVIGDQRSEKQRGYSLVNKDMQLSLVAPEFLHGLLYIVLVGSIHPQPKIQPNERRLKREIYGAISEISRD